jgi:aminomethyltransferase
LFCVNASNQQKDFEWIRDNARDVEVIDRSADFAQLALQGPSAERILQPLTPVELHALRAFFAVQDTVAGVPALISRTGYTGEDGFELYVAPERAEALWERLLDDGASEGLVPVGLGARDTLRLEKGLMLYGNDIDETTTPLEAGLGWVVKLDKGDFIGREALARQKAEGLHRRLVGLTMDESPPPPRHGYAVKRAGRSVGVVTSGTQSPTLGRGIALAIVESPSGEIGTRLEVEIRSRQHPGEVVPLPFVRRRK